MGPQIQGQLVLKEVKAGAIYMGRKHKAQKHLKMIQIVHLLSHKLKKWQYLQNKLQRKKDSARKSKPNWLWRDFRNKKSKNKKSKITSPTQVVPKISLRLNHSIAPQATSH